ncbi:hypothetical protein [uncultured Pseudodesulfovibrio sp.]|uniref:hypothetical protein n=1 Tax=uncultured Pseudodesulfovibrio sp. TaxID=2035858 RepID=UPI0029C7EC5F|nr:hypothetical protein [uncultured Pseudodesulfovibrio sp.]
MEGGRIRYAMRHLLRALGLAFFVLVFVASGAWAVPRVGAVYSTTKQGEKVLVVTCLVELTARDVKAPRVTVALLGPGGIKSRRMAGYGGRYYAPWKISRLSRQTALAATASPVSSKVKKSGVRKYQYLFFDLPDGVEKVMVSVERDGGKRENSIHFLPGKAGERKAVKKSDVKKIPVAKKKISPQKATAAKKGAAPLRQSASSRKEPLPVNRAEGTRMRQSSLPPNLVEGSGHVTLDRMVIVSYLDDEVRRLLEGKKVGRKPVPPRRTASHTRQQAKAALAPFGIVPLWEYLHIGQDIKDAPKRLVPDVYASAGAVKMQALDCVSLLCEYALPEVENSSGDYRLYFQKDLLRSMVVVLSFSKAEKRKSFLEALRSVYGGSIWDRGAGPELGDMVSRFEFHCEFEGMTFETSGKLLRVFAKEL